MLCTLARLAGWLTGCLHCLLQDEDEQDAEDARQLRAVAGGTPLHQAVGATALAAAAPLTAAPASGTKRRVSEPLLCGL